MDTNNLFNCKIKSIENNLKNRIKNKHNLNYYISKRLDKSLMLYDSEMNKITSTLLNYKDITILKRI